MNFYEKIILILKQPGVLIRYRSLQIRKIYFYLSKYFHLKIFFKRKRKIDYKSNLHLYGFEKIEIETLIKNDLNIGSMISELEEKIKNFNYLNKNSHIETFDIPDIFDTDSKVFNFLTSKYLIDLVSKYLGCIPLLTYSSIWYSNNQKIFENSSQEYHLDHEDYMQVKGFLYLEDIDEKNGAMNLFSKEYSKRVVREINYKTSPERKRVEDGLFSKYENEKIVCKGKKGTLYLVDTSKCFHCGARKSLDSRLLLTFQFITPWANYLEWNWKNSEIIKKNNWKIKELNNIQKKIIGIK